MLDESTINRLNKIVETVRASLPNEFYPPITPFEKKDEIDWLADTVDRLLEIIDIYTAEKEKSQTAQRDCEEKHRRLRANIPGMVYTFAMRPDGTSYFLDVNDASKELFDISPEDLMDDSNRILCVIHPDDLERFNSSVKRSFITMQPWREVVRHIVNGEVRWYDCMSRPEMQPNGDCLWDGIMLEVTDRKRAEREQENLQKQLVNAVEMAHLGHWEYDVAKDLFLFNDHFYKIFRSSATKVGRYTMSSAEYADRFVHPDNASIVEEEIRKAFETTDPNYCRQFEHRMLYEDGILGYLSVRFSIVKDIHGKTVKIYGVNQDITERKIAEQKLRESEEKLVRSKKMESLGLLAGGVAHDLNNVLSGIVSYPELLLLNLSEDSHLKKPIETIQACGHKAAAIVQDLLTIARGVAIEKQPLNLNDVINSYVRSPEHLNILKYHTPVTVTIDLDPQLLNIKGSSIHIAKAVMNLVSNACEAVGGSGKVTISTENRYMDQPLKGYDDVKVGEYTALSTSDTGPGISPDDLERIFEPFYSKKIMGRSGTGLGLAVVWNVVQDHNGYIDVSVDENGTTFELYFPITRDELWKKDPPLSLDDYRGNGEAILVVDDEKSQREIFSSMLNMLGYKVETVSCGEDAVDYLKENTVDLILLDMIMEPGINGRETFKRIKKSHPEQRAIIVSGFAETEEVKQAQQLGAGKYIKKPVRLEKIGRAIKHELDS